MVLGAFSITRLPVDVLPDLNKQVVTIMTEAEGALRRPKLNCLVTFPIETQMNGVSGRHARSLGIGSRIVLRLCRIRLEQRRHLSQPAARGRATEPHARPVAGECDADDGSDRLDHGTDYHCRRHQRPRHADGSYAKRPTSPSGHGCSAFPASRKSSRWAVRCDNIVCRRNRAALRALGVNYEQIEKALLPPSA